MILLMEPGAKFVMIIAGFAAACFIALVLFAWVMSIKITDQREMDNDEGVTEYDLEKYHIHEN
ncbi:MAG: hypothetical protein JST87_05485 [Bacteroidetes bacterium]|nr:hypothetical protein [Bacteroidota bacterium]